MRRPTRSASSAPTAASRWSPRRCWRGCRLERAPPARAPGRRTRKTALARPRHDPAHHRHPAPRRPAPRHLGPAQEGRRCSSSRTTWRISSSPSSTRSTASPADAGAGRRRPLSTTARRSRSSCAWRRPTASARVLVGQGGILSTPAASLRDPQARRLRRHHPVGQPQPGRAGRRLRHQVQHRQRRPGAREGHRGDLRSARKQISQLPHRSTRPTSISTALGDAAIGDMTRSR